MSARARASADQNVHPEVLERRIEDFLDVRQQPVNFVDEKYLALPNVGKYSGEIELLLQDRARSLFEADAQLGCDDSRERCLPQAGRPVQQHVVHRLSALLGGFDGDGQVLLELGLTGAI